MGKVVFTLVIRSTLPSYFFLATRFASSSSYEIRNCVRKPYIGLHLRLMLPVCSFDVSKIENVSVYTATLARIASRGRGLSQLAAEKEKPKTFGSEDSRTVTRV